MTWGGWTMPPMKTCVPLRAFVSLLAIFVVSTIHAAGGKSPTWTDAADETLPADFAFQGEFAGDDIGVQVIALGSGALHAVVYPGGLPGAGWDGKSRSLMAGALEDGKVALQPAEGERRYLAKEPEKFSASKDYPPAGQQSWSATIALRGKKGKKSARMTLVSPDGAKTKLKKNVRKSPMLGAKPPKGAIVLFDGSNKDAFEGGRLDEATKLLNTDGSDIRTKKKFNNYTMHVEFMLPFRPDARGQGRGNSGFYQVDNYEVQVLDSFGLEGVNNECGGVYTKAKPLVNMCLPPLTWQTYDVTFRNAMAKDGEKIKNAFMTLKHNGVVIHDNLEITGKTGGSRKDPEGAPGPIRLQGHGNPLQYRNIWIVEED
jgi:hypothetical protein